MRFLQVAVEMTRGMVRLCLKQVEDSVSCCRMR